MPLLPDPPVTQRLSNPRPKQLSLDLRRAVVRVGRVFPTNIVSLLLDVSVDTVRRLIQLQDLTGDVKTPKSGVKKGRPPILNDEDLQVSILIVVIAMLSLLI
jgi:hypothetical protein